MKAFLSDVATAIVKEHGTALREVAVVLPSRRAGLYLRNHLAQVAGKALWSPDLYTIPEFLERIGGLRTVDGIDALFELYEASRLRDPQRGEAFSEFLSWAPTALRDMSEVDAHLIDHDRFYRDLRAIEELENWSLRTTEELSPGQRRLLDHWTVKGSLHAVLNEGLRVRGLGLSGAVERTAADRCTSGTVVLPWKAVWVVGVNALTPAQQRVVKHLRECGIARLAFDADRYYLDDPQQEAGRYLRAIMRETGEGLIPSGNDLREHVRRVESISVPNEVAQCWHAAALLAGLSQDERQRTAVLLADESLLMPLLRALPEGIGPVNVTMGLPLRTLPAFALAEAVIGLHERGTSGAFYHGDLEAVLAHPFLQRGPDHRSLDLLERIMREQRVHVRQEDLTAWTSDWPADEREALLAITAPWIGGAASLGDRVLSAIDLARRITTGDAFAQEQLFHLAGVQQRLGTLLRERLPDADVLSFARIHLHLLRLERIGFFGEPLQGLQIMGVLEARAVDHERIIVLSASEDTLPPGDGPGSFIPHDVRRVFGLPMRTDTDAVAAYSFLRTLQRARHVSLIHSSGGERSEPSRFIEQLRHELLAGSNTTLLDPTVAIGIAQRDREPLRVQKDPAVLALLRSRLERGLSPSSISTWLRCPLDFWFRYVLRLNELEEVGERLGDHLIGTAAHFALERVFNPFVGRDLRSLELRNAILEVPALVRRGLDEVLPGRSNQEGQPLLQVEMATMAIQRYLKEEARRIDDGDHVSIHALEMKLGSSIVVDLPGGAARIPISGKLDRAEQRNGSLHILDYKTGGIGVGKMGMRDLNAFDPARPNATQLLIYSWLWFEQHPDTSSLQAGLVPLRDPSRFDASRLRVAGEPVLTAAHTLLIEPLLRNVVLDMLDPMSSIAHDPLSEYCAFCAH